jgi:hypothetical protein
MFQRLLSKAQLELDSGEAFLFSAFSVFRGPSFRNLGSKVGRDLPTLHSILHQPIRLIRYDSTPPSLPRLCFRLPSKAGDADFSMRFRSLNPIPPHAPSLVVFIRNQIPWSEGAYFCLFACHPEIDLIRIPGVGACKMGFHFLNRQSKKR